MANGLLEQYQKDWDWLIGVEMEAGGTASAIFSQVSPPGFFMVRAASDLADPGKDTPDTRKWREYACDVAASFAIGLLESGPILSLASDAP
jgi:nucleoside phosphorylase